MQGRTIAFWFLLLPLMLGAGRVNAQARTPDSASERRIDTWIRAGLDLNDPPAWDIGVTALGIGMIVVGTQLMDPPNGNIAPLDGAGHRAHHPTSDTVSDVLLYAGMPLMLLAAYGSDTTSEDHGTHNIWVGALRVPVVVVEAWLLANGVTALIKNAGVCRPYAWQDDSNTCSRGSAELGSTHWTHSAFLSGHSANVASVAGSLFGMWVLPSRPQKALGVVTLVASALAVTMAALRVDAGAHSIVDVTSGFALGFGLGFGTAALHL